MSYLPIGNELKKMWLVVEWKASKNSYNGYCLISSDDLTDNLRLEDFHTGKLVNVNHNGIVRQACIVIVSVDKSFLEMEIKHLQEAAHQIGLSKKIPSKEKRPRSTTPVKDSDSNEDFLHSGSDWNPCSEDEDTDNILKTNSKSALNCKKMKTSKIVKKVPKIKTKRNSISVQEKNPIMDNSLRTEHMRHISSSIHIQRRSSVCPNLNQQNNFIDNSSDKMDESFQNSLNGNLYPSRQRSFIALGNNIDINKVPPMTFDQQTQTNLSNIDPNCLNSIYENQNTLSAEIAYLHKIIEEMNQKMNTMQQNIDEVHCSRCERRNSPIEIVPEVVRNTSMIYDPKITDIENTPVLKESNRVSVEKESNNISRNSKTWYAFPGKQSTYQQPDSEQGISNTPIVQESSPSEMVPIGSGKTLVPRHIYNQIKWSSYSNATRKLLMAVFPRRTLATHSLTGKSSPAFSSKPPKMKLDAKKITDIIMTVSQTCKVQENLIRNIITTKCSDENKMYRIRLEKQRAKKQKDVEENEENNSP